MRYFALIILLLTTSGCAFVKETMSTCPGLRSYDPQLCKGESFQQLPNFEHEAIIRRQRGEMW